MKEINKEQLLNELLAMETSFNLVAKQFRELRERLDTRPTDRALAAAARKHQRELDKQRSHDSMIMDFYRQCTRRLGKEYADRWLAEEKRVKTPEEIAAAKAKEASRRKEQRDHEKWQAERKQMKEEAAQRKALLAAGKPSQMAVNKIVNKTPEKLTK